MNSNTSLTAEDQDTNEKEKRIVNGETEGLEERLRNEKMLVEIEPKTGVLFEVKLSDGKQLKAMGVRKKKVLGFSIKIYSFGIYADNQKLMGIMKSKIVESPAKATTEMYKMVIDSAVGITVKMVIVFANLTMSMVRKNLNEGLAEAIRKLGGGKNEELMNRIMGEANNDIKLTPGSEIEITCLPGYVIESKVNGKIVSKFESETLCRAYIYLYLGDDPLDKEAKEKFGMSLISLF